MDLGITILVLILTIGPLLMAYVLGSIPTSVWISKWVYGIDIRKFGSKNAGTTNTLRVLGKWAATPVLIVDILKGFFAVFITHYTVMTDNTTAMCLLGLFAIIGHIFPIFAGFKGGRGVATSVGVSIALFPMATLLCIPVFLISIIYYRIVSLSSIIASLSLPAFVYILTNDQTLTNFSMVIPVILMITHHKNIKRIINKTEPKFTLL
jgi:glycerol-3-phosphate acyltransferase PlsY